MFYNKLSSLYRQLKTLNQVQVDARTNTVNKLKRHAELDSASLPYLN